MSAAGKKAKAKKKTGRVQLLRLQANRSRRDNFTRFDGNIDLALLLSDEQQQQRGVVVDNNDNEAIDNAQPLLLSSSSNFETPLFVVFDWVAFPLKVRQQYYDQLRADFPGEFIYISASDDFASLQGRRERARVLSVCLVCVCVLSVCVCVCLVCA